MLAGNCERLTRSGFTPPAVMPTFLKLVMRSSLEAQLPQKIMGMNYQQRFQVFCVCLLLSAVFFALGFFVGVPLLTVRPQKFALCFTFGSLTFMGSFSMLSGPAAHLRSMLSPDRLAFTGVYLSTTFSTLYLTFSYGGVSGYFLVLASTCLQLLARAAPGIGHEQDALASRTESLQRRRGFGHGPFGCVQHAIAVDCHPSSIHMRQPCS